MKSAFVLVVCVLALLRPSASEIKLPQEIIDLLINVSATCKAEAGIGEDVVALMRKGNVPEDPKAKCYLKCMMMQLQSMKEDGNLDIELIEASMPDVLKAHGGLETVHKCKHIHNPDLCETAYQLVLCFKNENPQLANLFE